MTYIGVFVSSSAIRIHKQKFKYFFEIRPTPPTVEIQGVSGVINETIK